MLFVEWLHHSVIYDEILQEWVNITNNPAVLNFSSVFNNKSLTGKHLPVQ